MGTDGERGHGVAARLDRRTRWRSLAALALLIAVGAATVLAAIAGARRGESAMRRFQERSAPVTVLVPPGAKGLPSPVVLVTWVMLSVQTADQELIDFLI